MKLVDRSIEEYCERFSTPESEALSSLNRETHLKVLMPQMLSGHLQGSFLSMLSFMARPKYILEVGTYTGYSAINLASGLMPDGHLHTIDINEELQPITQKYFYQEGLTDKITMHIGNALEIIPTLDVVFDLVFIDADKINYANYYDLVFDKVATGGLIVADNVLWSGKVLNEKMDKDTLALHNYNIKINEDYRVTNFLLPLRDGLMIARKTV